MIHLIYIIAPKLMLLKYQHKSRLPEASLEAVVFNKVSIIHGRRLWCAPPAGVIEVNMMEPKPLGVSSGPLEVVQQGPGGIPSDVTFIQFYGW